MTGDGTDLSKTEVTALASLHGVELKGGHILKTRRYVDPTGEARQMALIDFGIAGTKKFDASEHELAMVDGKVEPRLEDLPMARLQEVAAGLGLGSPSGRPSPVKLIVGIRAKLRADAEAEASAEAGSPAETGELETAFGPKIATVLAEAGFPDLLAVAAASDEDLLAVKGIGKGALRAIRAAG
jgi:hypothetical protein